MELQKNNAKIKYLRKLARRQFRKKEQKFIIEGVRFVEELFQSKWPVEALFYTNRLTAEPRGEKILSSAIRQKIPYWQVAESTFNELADTDTPQGVLAVVKMPQYQLEDLFCADKNSLLVLVDGVQDPGNLGTIVRTADALAASGVVLLKGTVDLYNPKTLRSTMGSIFHLPIVMVEDLEMLLQTFKVKNINIVVGEPRGGIPLPQVDLTQPVALLVGSEASGPSQELMHAAQIKATIPMPGRAESLNAGVACSIMLYEVIRQRG